MTEASHDMRKPDMLAGSKAGIHKGLQQKYKYDSLRLKLNEEVASK